MSMVYLAQDLEHDRRVAFKVLVMPSLTAPLADCYRLEQELGQGGMATLYPRMALHVEVIHQRLRGAAALSSLG
jgi:hypothetical protein